MYTGPVATEVILVYCERFLQLENCSNAFRMKFIRLKLNYIYNLLAFVASLRANSGSLVLKSIFGDVGLTGAEGVQDLLVGDINADLSNERFALVHVIISLQGKLGDLLSIFLFNIGPQPLLIEYIGYTNLLTMELLSQ